MDCTAQYLYVAGQMHDPAMHGIPVGQTLPQEPQLFLSFTTSLHVPLQNCWPGGQSGSQMQVVVFSCS
jgi:hypothetical protein